MSDWNPWKMTAIGMALVMVTALVTGLVVASWNSSDKPQSATPTVVSPAPPSSAPAPGPPPMCCWQGPRSRRSGRS